MLSLWENPFKLFVILFRNEFFAHMHDERYLRLLYRGVTGRRLHLNPPVLYSEKIQWLKLHDKNPIYPVFCDKLAVRGFVRERVGEEHLVELYGVWDDPDEIDFSALPEQFVLKCTHDSGSAIICKDKSQFDIEDAKQALRSWLRHDYSIRGREWPYKGLPRRIMAERYLVNADGSRAMDYKFFCFNGKAEFVLIRTNTNEKYIDNFTFLRDFTRFQIYLYKVPEAADTEVLRPPHYEEMIDIAEKLSAGFVHLRVDLYDTPEGIKFGEQTLYNASGLSKLMTLEGDRFLGDLLQLNSIQ
jgi:hypothetical protein